MKHRHCKCENCAPHANNPYIKRCDNDTKSNNTGSQNGWSNGASYGTNGYTNSTSFFSTGNTQRDFIVGALIGAAASFILTNENAQKALLKGFAKLSSLFEMGVEELKERYEDAKAEVNS